MKFSLRESAIEIDWLGQCMFDFQFLIFYISTIRLTEHDSLTVP
jgi:hypothetical protein